MRPRFAVPTAALAFWVLSSLACAPAAPAPGQPERIATADGEIIHRPPADARHLAGCSQSCGDEQNPPTGGPHCARWLECRRYQTAQSRCLYLHNLEHGHAVFAYRCPDGCPEVVSALEALWRRQPVQGQAPRAILTPDPALPRTVAVMVWGWAYSGDSVDVPAIEQVLAHQDREAPEPNLPCNP